MRGRRRLLANPFGAFSMQKEEAECPRLRHLARILRLVRNRMIQASSEAWIGKKKHNSLRKQCIMTNMPDILGDAVRFGKALRRYSGHPNKAKKHRYERRKVRGFIRTGEWSQDQGF